MTANRVRSQLGVSVFNFLYIPSSFLLCPFISKCPSFLFHFRSTAFFLLLYTSFFNFFIPSGRLVINTAYGKQFLGSTFYWFLSFLLFYIYFYILFLFCAGLQNFKETICKHKNNFSNFFKFPL